MPPDTPRDALPASLRRDAPLRGIGLTLLSTIFLSTADITSKFLAGHVPALQITWLRYVSFAVIMLLLVWRAGGLARLRTSRPVLQFLRGLCVAMASILFVMSLKYLPIADAVATSFVTPLFVTALSIPLLGEKVGWRRWTATLVGLAGVLIVVRPGGAAFQPASLLPVASALAWACGLIVTRLMSNTESPLTTLTYSALIGLVIVSLLQPLSWQALTGQTVMLGILIGVFSTIGHWMVIAAFRYADASVLAPFSYAQLLFASLFGFILFSVLPDVWVVIGAVVIAASGLYIAHRERVRARMALGVGAD